MRCGDSCTCVLIRWTDIASYDGAWLDLSDAKDMKPGSMETLGWIIKETPEFVVVASTVDRDEDIVGSVNAIPRAVITEIVPRAVGCPQDAPLYQNA